MNIARLDSSLCFREFKGAATVFEKRLRLSLMAPVSSVRRVACLAKADEQLSSRLRFSRLSFVCLTSGASVCAAQLFALHIVGLER